jgi:outer membrane receptor for ferrienterochelin and colicin
LTLVALMACATAGTRTPGVRRDPNLLTQQEIAEANVSTAYEAISKLRPMFLKTRGRTTINGEANDYAVVFVDGQRFGSLNSLNNILASSILEARFLPGSEAVNRYGMQYGGGAIDIKTR